MKKKIFWFAALFIIAAFAVTLFIPKNLRITRITVINANSKAINRLFENNSNISNWWPVKHKQAVSASTFAYKQFIFSFTKISDFHFSVSMVGEKDSIDGNIWLQKLPGDSTVIKWTCNQQAHWLPTARVYNYLKAKKLSETIDELYVFLKQYAENKKQLYGYDIVAENLTDSLVIVHQQKTTKLNLYRQLQTNFAKLNHYIQEKGLRITGNYMSSIQYLQNDSVLVMTGIPANTYAAPEQQINYMQMPPGGHMLTVMYKGMYKDRLTVYKAMEQFISDYDISIVSLPYEKLVHNTIPSSDSSVVELKIYFPVF